MNFNDPALRVIIDITKAIDEARREKRSGLVWENGDIKVFVNEDGSIKIDWPIREPFQFKWKD
jgi:hypothetical protein